MLDDLGIASRPSNMSFSVRAEGGLEYGSATLSALFAQRRNLFRPTHYRLLAEILRFLGRARSALLGGTAFGRTLDEFVERHRISRGVYDYFVAPLAGALWSMGRRPVGSFPAEVFFRFLDMHGMLRPVLPLHWRTIVGGSRTYVDALLARLPIALHLATGIRQVARDAGGVTLGDDEGNEHRFDRVVLAVHADDALAMLAEPSEAERSILGSIRYTHNDVWLHTDGSRLPENPAARASWNYVVERGGSVSVTYWLNALQGIDSPRDYCVTLNPRSRIEPRHVIAQFVARHPLLDTAATFAQGELPRLQGSDRTFFAGAYFGFGFHEDGMRAGLAAAARVLAGG
jgi:predicted NAD/FAD-binding protein